VYDYLGQIAIVQKELEKIKNYYELLLELDSLNVNALNALGTIYLRENRIAKAKSLFEKVIMHHPDDELSHLNLGILFGMSDNLTEAENHLLEAAGINSQNARAFQSLGFFYLKNEFYEKAELTLLKAVEIEPNDADSHLGLGISISESIKA